MQFSPDGRFIATGSIDSTARIWDTSTGTLLHTLRGHTSILVAVRFSPDGRYVATASRDFTVRIWDIGTGACIQTLKGHIQSVRTVRFSPDGRVIITSSWDSSIKYWNPETGLELLIIYILNNFDWVVIHPSGLFDATAPAMKSMYYLWGREVIEFDQLKERYYEPGLFQKTLARDGRGLRDVKKFESVEMYPEVWAQLENDTLRIRLKARNSGIGKISLFLNRKEVLEDANTGRDTVLSIALAPFEKYYRTDTLNEIGLRVYNAEGWLKSSEITLNYRPEFMQKKALQALIRLIPKVDNSLVILQ